MQQERRQQILKGMLQTAQRSQQTSIETKNQLYNQSQKLTRIQKATDKLDKQSDKTKKLSRQIYSFWYYLKDKFIPNKKEEKVKNGGKEEDRNKRYQVEGNQVREKNVDYGGQQKEISEEDALDLMCQKMKSVKKAQKQIGQQVDSQNKRIEAITEKNQKISQKFAQSQKMLNKKL